MTEQTASTGNDEAILNSIGSLEHHLHNIFAAVRVPGEDFVYTSTPDLFNSLEDYCNVQTMHEVKPPLLLMGNSGTGKSALLANWLQRRQRNASRSRISSDEFIFWHAVGCSRQSMNVNYLIRRLMTDLKLKFELSRDVPVAQERLSWEFPRFLDLASKRGKIIVVIDGLNRLVSNDDSDAGWSWLPLEFPPNVRIILSATTYSAKDLEKGDPATNAQLSHKSQRILMELSRRNWQLLKLKPLERVQCRGVVESFIRKSVQNEASSQTTGLFLTALAQDMSSQNQPLPLDQTPGFLLFDTQVAALLTHSQGSTPLFLRLFLRCTHFAITRGFSLWHIWDDWLQADSVQSLLARILQSLETGFSKNRNSAQADCDRTINAGGLPALRLLYPWHPAFQPKSEECNDTLVALDFRSQAEEEGAPNETASGGGGSAEIGNGNHASETKLAGGALSSSVLQSLGDQQWLAASHQADAKLEEAWAQTERTIHDNLDMVAKLAKDEGISFVDALVERMQELRIIATATVFHRNGRSSYSEHRHGRGGPGDNCISNDIECLSEGSGSEEDDTMERDDSTTLDKDEESADAFTPLNTMGSRLHTPSGTDPIAAAALVMGHGRRNSQARNDGRKMTSRSFAQDDDRRHPHTDPSEGLETLPLYLRGGGHAPGFGSLIGDALALLYVARHGLKEMELWTMLAALQHQRQQEKEASRTGAGHDVEGATKALLIACAEARGHLEEYWRSDDNMQTGTLTRQQLSRGMVKVHPEFRKADLQKLLEMVGLSEAVNEAIDSYLPEDIVTDYDTKINYIDFLKRIVKLDRKRRHADHTKGRTNGESTNIDNVNIFELQEPSALWEEGKEGAATNASALDHLTSLGPMMETSLLSVLCALGVLHSPDNQVLLLPCDGDLFRQVVKTQFVNGRGGEEVWHGHLIRFFQRERNTMRRCEELPWHLQICRKWHVMKDAVADLATFEMMYSSDLRDELMSYWLLLTEGPLYVSDEAEKRGTMILNKQATHQQGNEELDVYKILNELDTADALGLSEKEARKQMMKSQVSPFDIVEEFSCAVDAAVTANHPSSVWIHTTIMNIANFLIEYSRRCKPSPTCLRLGIDTKAMALFGVSIYELKEGDFLGTNASTGNSNEDDKEKSSALATNAALDHDINGKTMGLTPKAIVRGHNSGAMIAFPSQQLINSNLYHYMRWIWMLFPWLALRRSPEVGLLSESSSLKGGKTLGEDLSRSATGLGRVGSASTRSAGNGTYFETDSNSAPSDINESSPMHAQRNRSWEVKKADPNITIVNITAMRKLSAIKSVSAASLTSIDAVFKSVHDELLQSSAAATSKVKTASRYRRGFADELEATKTIPHSYHCIKSIRNATLFPSLDTSMRERNKKLEEDGELFAKATVILKRGGEGLHFSPELDDEIQRLNAEEAHRAYNAKHGGPIPFVTDEEIAYEQELDRLSRLRSVADKMIAVRQERLAIMKEFKEQTDKRDSIDQDVSADLVAGEMAIHALNSKFNDLTRTLEDCKNMNRGHQLLIQLLMRCPAYTEKHMTSLEQEVALARQQVADLRQCRHNLYLDTEKLDFTKRRQIHDKIQYYKVAKQAVIAKRKNFFLNAQSKGLPIAYSSEFNKAGERIGLCRYRDDSSENRSIQSFSSHSSSISAQPVVNDVMKRFGDAISKHSLLNRPLSPSRIHEEKPYEVVVVDSTASSGGAALDGTGLLIAEGGGSPHNTGALPSAFAGAVGKLRNRMRRQDTAQSDVNGGNVRWDADGLEALSHIQIISEEDKVLNARQLQFKQQFDYVIEKTGSTGVDEFIDRFKSAQKLTESLRSHQVLADSKLAQLRTEHGELYESWGETLFVAQEGAPSTPSAGQLDQPSVDGTVVLDAPSLLQSNSVVTVVTATSGAPEEHDTRYYDNNLFATEMRLGRVQRQLQKSIQLMTSFRMGVGHLIDLLQANVKLLSNLPKSSPPELLSDEDITKALSWCEERILAINEAHMLDSSKPANVTDDSKPLLDRQVQLAGLVHDMLKHNKRNNDGIKKRKKGKQVGGMSKGIIDVSDSEFAVISSPRGVTVPTAGEVDRMCEEKMLKVVEKRDRQEAELEKLMSNAADTGQSEGVHKFLGDALNTTESQSLLRRANIMSKKKQGRNAGYGFALEDLLKSKGPTFAGAIAHPLGSKSTPHLEIPTATNNIKEKQSPKIVKHSEEA